MTLAQWRETRGWNTRNAAQYLGFSQTKYVRLENGDRLLRKELEALRVHDLTAVPMDDLRRG